MHGYGGAPVRFDEKLTPEVPEIETPGEYTDITVGLGKTCLSLIGKSEHHKEFESLYRLLDEVRQQNSEMLEDAIQVAASQYLNLLTSSKDATAEEQKAIDKELAAMRFAFRKERQELFNRLCEYSHILTVSPLSDHESETAHSLDAHLEKYFADKLASAETEAK